MRVLIVGAGAIGASVACHLAMRGAEVTVIEREAVACAASGHAGGFLALDWCDGTPLMALARRSFARHAELSEQLGGGWGYRPMTTYGGVVGRAARPRRAGPPDWISAEVAISRRLGSETTTAQVNPAAFTAGLMRAAQAHGARLQRGRVQGLLRRGDKVEGVELDGGRREADAVVLALGPWSIAAAGWLDMPPVFGLKGHSLVFETGTALPPEALFLECREPDGTILTPELFPRSDGTTYVCGISSETALPAGPRAVAPDPGAIRRLTALCGRLSPVLADARILTRAACFRPITADGLPLIGSLPGVRGGFVATGHGVWGILNAPATGEAMAGLLLDGATRLDLSPFDPARLPPAARVASRRGHPAVHATPA